MTMRSRFSTPHLTNWKNSRKVITLGKRSKRIIFFIALCLAATMLTGCGASLTVYDYVENDVRYNAYELTVDSTTLELMERTAATDENGNKYTVAEYFYELFTDFGYSLVSAVNTDKAYTVRYAKAITGNGELFAYGTALDYSVTYTENPFVRTYTQTSPNPFNGVRAAYEAVLPLRSSTVLERLKNGAVAINGDVPGEIIVSQPALVDAFPYLKGMDPDGLLLGYAVNGSSRMTSSGVAAELGDNRSRYTFWRYFDLTDSAISFSYTRPIAYGWYLSALGAGAVVLAIIVLITRQKKQKQQPTLLDRFPYNPEEYRDYESHLPAKR